MTARATIDRAIVDYNEAIRLDPKFAQAYSSRGLAYYQKGDLDRAIADYGEAIRLDPKYAYAYNNRGNAYYHKHDENRAIVDYSEAIRLDPKYAQAYFNRGVANLYAGWLPKALADLGRSSELNPKYAYAALWLHIVDTRSNLPSQLAEAAKQLDMNKWPAPVIRLFLGQMTPEALLAAADDPNAKTKQRKVCEVNFYTAELALHRHAKDEATRLFRLAATDCPKSFAERAAAHAELKALDAPRFSVSGARRLRDPCGRRPSRASPSSSTRDILKNIHRNSKGLMNYYNSSQIHFPRKLEPV